MQETGSIDPIWTRRILEFVSALESADTGDAALELFRQEIAQVGFHSHLITALDEREFSQRVVARCWHPDWAVMYAEEDLNQTDPIRWKLAQHSASPFLWSEAANEVRDDKPAQTVMHRATEFGMNEGLCVQVQRKGRPIAAISIAGEKPDLGPGVRPALHIMSVLSYNRYFALTKPKIPSCESHKRLTDREREVLQWVLAGKSDRDIGEILNISKRTALAHVVNAVEKLNAANRTAAVVEALRAGEISINH
jgi:LuxR family quorum sensing-dependent transcriptional regulator